MLRPSILLSLAFSALTVAQTPEGFTPAVQTQLGVVYPGNITVTPSGVLLQAAGTALPFPIIHQLPY